MWSAGVLFYLMVTRELPFIAQNANIERTFQKIKENNPDLTKPAFLRFIPEAKDMIQQMLVKDPL